QPHQRHGRRERHHQPLHRQGGGLVRLVQLRPAALLVAGHLGVGRRGELGSGHLPPLHRPAGPPLSLRPPGPCQPPPAPPHASPLTRSLPTTATPPPAPWGPPAPSPRPSSTPPA